MIAWTAAGALSRHRGWCVLLALVLLVPLLIAVQHTAAQTQDRLSVDQVIVSREGDSLTALVSVVDRAGRSVVGLTAFAATLDGAPVPLHSVEPVVDNDAGVALLLLIDVSGSMRGEPLAQAQAAAATLVEGLLPQDIAAIAPFAGHVSDQLDFTADRAALHAAIGALAAEQTGGTALYEAVVKGLAASASAPVSRRAVVLLTDGQDTGEANTARSEDALYAAAVAGLPVFAVGLGEDADVTFLRTLAEVGGGAFYLAPAPADVLAVFDAIAAKLRSHYALTMALPPASSAWRELGLSVDVEGATVSALARFQAPAVAIVPAGEGRREDPAPWLWPATIVLVSLLIAAAGSIPVHRYRRRRAATAGGPGDDISLPSRPANSSRTESPPAGRLAVVAGPNAGASVPVSSDPVEIGSGPASGLRLDSADGAVAGSHARVWLQGNRFMLHHLSRGRETLIGDKPVQWATLEPNDTLRIGPHVITFSLDD